LSFVVLRAKIYFLRFIVNLKFQRNLNFKIRACVLFWRQKGDSSHTCEWWRCM